MKALFIGGPKDGELRDDPGALVLKYAFPDETGWKWGARYERRTLARYFVSATERWMEVAETFVFCGPRDKERDPNPNDLPNWHEKHREPIPTAEPTQAA